MAVCGIWKTKTRLDNVINYTTNKEKTIINDLYKDLRRVIDYTSKDVKEKINIQEKEKERDNNELR